jgi:hypothetical protein
MGRARKQRARQECIMTQSHPSVLGLVVKGILAGILYIVGATLTNALFAALHVALVNPAPPGADLHKTAVMFLVATPLLGLALVPLARHTAGSRLFRGLVIGFFIFICMGLTSVMEMRIFMTVYSQGGSLAAILAAIPPALFCGLALGYLLPQEQPEASAAPRLRTFFAAHSPISWAARFVLAILLFGVFYFLFGMLVAPFVVPFYRAGVLGLTLPPFSVIIPVLLMRSALFLLACLPFLMRWTRSRLSLILSLGLAHWFLTGGYGMLMVVFWPPVMRVGHGLEVAADSFAYAAALVFLLLPRQRENTVPNSAHVAPMFPS